jgi:hypothetical protein
LRKLRIWTVRANRSWSALVTACCVYGQLQANTISTMPAMTMSDAPMISHQRPGVHHCPAAWTSTAPLRVEIVELSPAIYVTLQLLRPSVFISSGELTCQFSIARRFGQKCSFYLYEGENAASVARTCLVDSAAFRFKFSRAHQWANARG